MKIHVGKYAGFCFGVNQAVALVEEAARSGASVCTLGPIIHNRHVVGRFAAMGGLIAPGSDAGAFAVPHGQGSVDEYRLLEEALGPGAQDVLARGIAALQARF